jgi:hypothetical protein
MIIRKSGERKKKLIAKIEKEDRQRKILEKLGFVQMMFDFYSAPVI